MPENYRTSGPAELPDPEAGSGRPRPVLEAPREGTPLRMEARGAFQDAPRALQECPQSAPRASHSAPRPLQEASKTAPGGLQELKRLQVGSKRLSGTNFGPSRGPRDLRTIKILRLVGGLQELKRLQVVSKRLSGTDFCPSRGPRDLKTIIIWKLDLCDVKV